MEKLVELTGEMIELIDLSEETVVKMFGGQKPPGESYGKLLVGKVQGPRVLVLKDYVHIGTVVKVDCAILTERASVDNLFAGEVMADQLARLGSIYSTGTVILAHSAVARFVKSAIVVIRDDAWILEGIEADLIIVSGRNHLPSEILGTVVKV